jgi:hypothetical protein
MGNLGILRSILSGIGSPGATESMAKIAFSESSALPTGFFPRSRQSNSARRSTPGSPLPAKSRPHSVTPELLQLLTPSSFIADL